MRLLYNTGNNLFKRIHISRNKLSINEDDIQIVVKLVKILSQMNGTQEERI